MGAGALERKGRAGSGNGALGAGSKLLGPIEAILVCSRRGIVRRDSWMLDVACLWKRRRWHMKAGSTSNSGPSGRYGNLALVRMGLGQRRHPLIPVTASMTASKRRRGRGLWRFTISGAASIAEGSHGSVASKAHVPGKGRGRGRSRTAKHGIFILNGVLVDGV